MKLRKAKFPEKKLEYNDYYYPSKQSFPRNYECEEWTGRALRIPTLSELIEACGDKFTNLHRNPNSGIWSAIAANGKQTYSGTHEEAVADLWLALNLCRRDLSAHSDTR